MTLAGASALLHLEYHNAEVSSLSVVRLAESTCMSAVYVWNLLSFTQPCQYEDPIQSPIIALAICVRPRA